MPETLLVLMHFFLLLEPNYIMFQQVKALAKSRVFASKELNKK